MAWACWCQWATSDCNSSLAAPASFKLLVERTSMRCAKSTAVSRCTMTWCCKSSTALIFSFNLSLRLASGSRDSGAPALAASLCHAMASAMFKREEVSMALARSAHSAAKTSWPCKRFNSSSFSRSTLAAPLSRVETSL